MRQLRHFTPSSALSESWIPSKASYQLYFPEILYSCLFLPQDTERVKLVARGEALAGEGGN